LPFAYAPCGFADAFADAETDNNNSKDYVHIRIQQRNGKKSLTTVQVILFSCLMLVVVCAYFVSPFLDFLGFFADCSTHIWLCRVWKKALTTRRS